MLPRLAIALLAVNAVFPTLAILFVILRLVARYRTEHRVDGSDYFAFLALLCALLNATNSIIGAVACGVGLPPSSLPPYMQVRFLKVLFAYQFLYFTAVWGVKMSVLLFYRAIFGANQRVMSQIKWTLVFLTIWLIVFFFATLFQDYPISVNWTGEGHKVNWRALYIVISLTNVLLDVFVLTIPISGIRELNLSRRKKKQLIGVFLLGAIIVVASTVRLVFVIIESLVYRHDRSDFSFAIVNILIWSSIEPCMSVVAACLPIVGATVLVKKPGNKSTYNAGGPPIMGRPGSVNKRGPVLDSIDLLELSAIRYKSTNKLGPAAECSDEDAQSAETKLSLPETAFTTSSRSRLRSAQR